MSAVAESEFSEGPKSDTIPCAAPRAECEFCEAEWDGSWLDECPECHLQSDPYLKTVKETK